MSKFWRFLVWFSAILSLVSIGLAWHGNFRTADPNVVIPSNEVRGVKSRIERIKADQTLRVGYIVFPPYFGKDAATGKFSGIFYDVTEKLGKNLGLKISWIEEASLATLATGFASDRYDIIAFPLWRSSSRAKAVAFSTPLFYSTVGAYVKENDRRFDGNLSLLNDPSVGIAAADGELALEIGKKDFPKAKVNSLPQMTDYSQLLLEVISGKSDVTFFNRVFANRFILKNPGRIRDISGSQPIRVYAETFIYPIGDYSLAHMIDSAILEMIENGEVDSAFAGNLENPQEYFRVAIPYRAPGK
jgi:polar amino acid transport system substrate-binding protein